MRLQLQDNSSSGMVKVIRKKPASYVYDPSTTDVHFINDFLPLEGKARKKRVKVRRADKAERQSIRHQGQKSNLLKRIAKRGRKQDNKFQPDTDQGGITTPDSGTMPQQSFAPSGGGGGGNQISPGGEDYSQPIQVQPSKEEENDHTDLPDEEETDPSTYEQLPDEEQPVDPYGGAMNDYYGYPDLSAGGIWGSVFTAAKGAAKGAVNQIKSQASNQVQSAIPQVQNQADQIAALQKQIDSNFTKQMITAGLSAAIGATAGYFIAKSK